MKKQQPDRNEDSPRVSLSQWWSRRSGCGPHPAPGGPCLQALSGFGKHSGTGRKKVCGESSGPCAGRRGLRQARAAAVLIAQEPLHPAAHTEVSRGLSRAEVRLATVLQVQGVCVCGPLPWERVQPQRNPQVPASRTVPGCTRAVWQWLCLCVLYRTGGGGVLRFSWVRDDSAVPGPSGELPGETRTAGPPRGWRQCVRSPAGTRR